MTFRHAVEPATQWKQIPGYSDIRHQACPMQGAHSGSAFVDGAVHAETMYGFTRTHLWRNFGIILAMWFIYTVLGAIGLSVMTRDSSSATGPVYKRHSIIPQKELSFDPRSAASATRAEMKTGSDSPDSDTTIKSVQAPPPDISKETIKYDNDNVSFGPVHAQQARAAFTFENIDYFVSAGGSEKKLLSQVSGYVKPGQLTALMGASGAGKTALLDNLSRRKTEGRMAGEILLGGAPLRPTFARSCGFCMQQDIHESTTTVREALQFSALLRQSAAVRKEEKFAYVEHIISLLELETIADALVGNLNDGQLNVVERKKVTIGVELAAKPSALLFLDEVRYILTVKH